jgi:glyoxylase-like metal-dependent hydrolase (beta-lactamase superfamily II)
MEVDLSAFTYRFNYGKKVWLPICCWYIEGAEKHILVDTAANGKMATELRGLPGKEIASFEDALGRVGVRPRDIDLVIQTHLQWDHCANTSKCRNARVVVSEDELKFALSPHPILAPTYDTNLLKHCNFMVVSGRTEIFPGVEVFPAPGHTPGTQAVSVNTAKGKTLITGFCCTRENFEPPEQVRETMPVVAPGIHLDAVQAYDSALRIKNMADILVPVHDPSYFEIETIP